MFTARKKNQGDSHTGASQSTGGKQKMEEEKKINYSL